jgi:hypothetical protein
MRARLASPFVLAVLVTAPLALAQDAPGHPEELPAR